jgi:hypothetical protein
MRAHLFQHVPFEGLGSIGLWLESRSAAVTGTRFFEECTLPILRVNSHGQTLVCLY